ncbi:hypothetical protein HNY73_018817 [Argiope bruennichi]|uniref:Uncharacterized protein n=1 Tax=Argiope bruennichi TaxID=94029 RepID=A0A8T0EES1_ARGBR|nr:hypothetical protein HNY73_018817 [Argiope bruennichi]
MVSASTQTHRETHEQDHFPASIETKSVTGSPKTTYTIDSNNKQNQSSPLKLNNERRTSSSNSLNKISSSRIPTAKADKKEPPKKLSKTSKETKAMRKARIQFQKKNLDDKIKDSIKKRTISKQELLKQTKYDGDHDERYDIKIHPSEDDAMSTSGEENITS